jgi:CheY-like chemotaxis protein
VSVASPRRDKVLVVEDDPWIRSILTELLEGEGYVVTEAADGLAGLELARSEEPDVIVLDLAMPGKTGDEVLRELKDASSTRDIPVIVVSAYTRQLGPGQIASTEGVIQKPFDVTDLLARLELATGRRQQRLPSAP